MSTRSATIRFVLPQLGLKDKEYNGMVFGRQIEYARIIRDWKDDPKTKTVHISMKRRSFAKALKEFKDLYKPTAWYVGYWDLADYRDDAVEFFFRE